MKNIKTLKLQVEISLTFGLIGYLIGEVMDYMTLRFAGIGMICLSIACILGFLTEEGE